MTWIAALTILALAVVLMSGKTIAAPLSSPTIPYETIFSRVSSLYRVPKRLMIAISAHETGGTFNPRSVNLETAADKKRGRDVDSLGLGQILYPDTAQQYAPGITREELFNPETNLDIMGHLLHDLVRRFGPLDPDGWSSDVVSAYNGGHPLKVADGYANQDYVDKVRAQWEGYNVV